MFDKSLELSIITFIGSFVCIQCYQKCGDVNNGMIGNIREKAKKPKRLKCISSLPFTIIPPKINIFKGNRGQIGYVSPNRYSTLFIKPALPNN